MESESTVAESAAFKEYARGRNDKVKAPWVTISISGILVGIAYFATNWLAGALFGNPWAFNFIIPLFGIPAGIACAMRNKNYTFLTSFRYSAYSALIASGTLFIYGSIVMLIRTDSAFGAFAGFLQLVLACVIIAIFSACCTFAFGALIGTMIAGVKDAKK